MRDRLLLAVLKAGPAPWLWSDYRDALCACRPAAIIDAIDGRGPASFGMKRVA